MALERVHALRRQQSQLSQLGQSAASRPVHPSFASEGSITAVSTPTLSPHAASTTLRGNAVGHGERHAAEFSDQFSAAIFETADEAARMGSNEGSSTSTLKDDAMAKHKVRQIALRLAAI